MRAFATLGGVAGLALACGGLSEPKVVERDGFSIALIDGSVDEDSDYGAEGDYDVSWGLTTQALSWNPIDETETLEEGVELMWDGMMAIIATDPSISTPMKPAFTSETVAGNPALGFEADLDGAVILSTSWRCPEAGLQVTLNTSGLRSGARSSHEASLKSAVCKTTPVAFKGDSKGWRFVGDPAVWTSSGEAGEQNGEWTRNDDMASLSAFPQSSLMTDDDLCRASMTMAVEKLDTIRVDTAKNRFRETRTGCVQDFEGLRLDDQVGLKGRFIHEGCGGRGYLVVCMVASDESLDAVCDNVIACPE